MDGIRDGNRGGRAHFSWEKVRVMPYRDRECYLGSTFSLGYLDKGGRWRKKDWWTKAPGNSCERAGEEELEEERQKDFLRIQEALGLAKPAAKQPGTLSAAELTQLAQKTVEHDDSAGVGYQEEKKDALNTKRHVKGHLREDKRRKKHREHHC